MASRYEYGQVEHKMSSKKSSFYWMAKFVKKYIYTYLIMNNQICFEYLFYHDNFYNTPNNGF